MRTSLLPPHSLVQAPAGMLKMHSHLFNTIPALGRPIQRPHLNPILRPPKIVIALYLILGPCNLAWLTPKEMVAPLHP